MKFFLLFFLLLPFHCLIAQNDTLQIQQDSIFTISKDTLIGKITVDKDKNQYIFNDSLVLLPTKIKRFIIFPRQNDAEIQVYEAIFDEFYLLELGQNEAITVYAKYSYSKVTDDGPTYYTVKKKYCLYKNKIPYFPRPEALKADLLILTADCSKLSKQIKQEKIRVEDLTRLIMEYNRCGEKN